MEGESKKFRNNEELKQIWVKKSTHKEIKMLCVSGECNFDEIIIKLIKQFKLRK